MKSKKTSLTVAPEELQVRLRFNAKPKYTHFTRHLVFRNHRGNSKRLPITFKRDRTKQDLEWIGSFPESIAVLSEISSVNNRSYWDNIFLVNFGGRTALPIAHLFVELKYAGIPSSCFSNIQIINCELNKTLNSGYSYISLNAFANQSRWKWAEDIVENKYHLAMPDCSAHPAVLLALFDLGKSGSDGGGQDAYGRNAKYGTEHSALCSEFVSWYYHETAVGLGEGNAFRDILATKDLHNVFLELGGLFIYDTKKRCFVGKESKQPYTPQPGDFLERQDASGKPEHSMMMLAWDSAIQRAVVINGPRPVTIRNVRVHDLSKATKDQKKFCVGSVTPAFRFVE